MSPFFSKQKTQPQSLETSGRVLVKAARVYDMVQPLVTLGQEARLNQWLANRIDPPPGAAILDIGCGTGLLTARIAERYPDHKVIGIDASRPMIDVACNKRSRANCSFQLALAEDLPFADDSFATVTSALFFHHVNHSLKHQTLKEVFRVLKAEGELLVADMDRPYTPLGLAMSWTAWKLLRQPEIKENMDGILRQEIVSCGFKDLCEIGRFSGYIRVFKARKSL